MSGEQKRLATAQASYAEAVRAERLARIAAAPDLRTAGRRRRASLRLLAAAATLTGIAVLAIVIAGVLATQSAQRGLDRAAAARDGAVAAISTMLSADPAKPDEYVDRVLAVTTGEQHERLSAARGELRGAIAELGAVSTGHVISAGVENPSGEPVEGSVPVVVVAQASAPELVGGLAGTDRVALRVTVVQSGDRWLISGTERVS